MTPPPKKEQPTPKWETVYMPSPISILGIAIGVRRVPDQEAPR